MTRRRQSGRPTRRAPGASFGTFQGDALPRLLLQGTSSVLRGGGPNAERNGQHSLVSGSCPVPLLLLQSRTTPKGLPRRPRQRGWG